MAGFFDKIGATLGGGAEGFLKGAGIAALMGGLLLGGAVTFGLGYLTYGLVGVVTTKLATAGAFSGLAGLAGFAVGAVGTIATAWAGLTATVAGGMGLAPYGGVIKAPFTAWKRLKQSNQADLAQEQISLAQSQEVLNQAEARAAGAVEKARGGYAEVPGMSQKGVPIDNPLAKGGHAAGEEKRRADLSQFANLGMTAGR